MLRPRPAILGSDFAIDACYPLGRITEAYRHVDAGHKKGNVIVTMTDHA